MKRMGWHKITDENYLPPQPQQRVLVLLHSDITYYKPPICFAHIYQGTWEDDDTEILPGVTAWMSMADVAKRLGLPEKAEDYTNKTWEEILGAIQK